MPCLLSWIHFGRPLSASPQLHEFPPDISTARYVEAGGLLSYGPIQDPMWRRSAQYIDKIFKGASPADLPVEQPTRFELVVNLKTAGALGLTIPQSILTRADEVIE